MKDLNAVIHGIFSDPYFQPVKEQGPKLPENPPTLSSVLGQLVQNECSVNTHFKEAFKSVASNFLGESRRTVLLQTACDALRAVILKSPIRSGTQLYLFDSDY